MDLPEKLRMIANGFATERVTTGQARSAVGTLNDAAAEIEKLRKELSAISEFHDFFRDDCEGLFAQFGMPAIDLYNEAARARRTMTPNVEVTGSPALSASPRGLPG